MGGVHEDTNPLLEDLPLDPSGERCNSDGMMTLQKYCRNSIITFERTYTCRLKPVAVDAFHHVGSQFGFGLLLKSKVSG